MFSAGMDTWSIMLYLLLLGHCMKEMLTNCWRNAIHWACLTGIVLVPFSFLLNGDLSNTDSSFFFPPINSIASLAVAQNMRELYRLVLVDTPLAPYFSECITSEVKTLQPLCCPFLLKWLSIPWYVMRASCLLCRIWMTWILRSWGTHSTKRILRIFTNFARYVLKYGGFYNFSDWKCCFA